MSIKSKVKRILRSTINLFKEEKIVPIPIQTNTTELLLGRTALVVGGTGGIGKAIAQSFIRNGAKVIITGTRAETLEPALAEIGGGTESLRSLLLNLNDIYSFSRAIGDAESLFGSKIDILVNAAGVINHSDFWQMTEDEYDKIMNANLKGCFFMCQAMGIYMKNNGIHGHILNVSSASALRPAWTPYQISKWAIRGFTEGLADTLLPYGITVNAIAPGPVATNMLKRNDNDTLHNPNTAFGRYAKPEEIANLATFMVSNMGDLIVGDTFYITGGSGVITKHR